MKYASLYERLVANTAEPESANGCWLWLGKLSEGVYPRINLWEDGKTVTKKPYRLMLELVHGVTFPFDEAGHLCCNPLCINPDHLEVQTSTFNLSERRRGGFHTSERSFIPCVFPVDETEVPDVFAEPSKANTSGERVPF